MPISQAAGTWSTPPRQSAYANQTGLAQRGRGQFPFGPHQQPRGAPGDNVPLGHIGMCHTHVKRQTDQHAMAMAAVQNR